MLLLNKIKPYFQKLFLVLYAFQLSIFIEMEMFKISSFIFQ